MSDYFQVSYDKRGDLWVADGLVMQPRTGVMIRTGTGLGLPVQVPLTDPLAMRDAEPFSRGQTLVGGSGLNIVLTTTVAGIPAVMRPYQGGGFTGGYVAGDFIARIVLPVPVGGAESVIEWDGVVIARLTGSLGILGTYAATTAGRPIDHAATAESMSSHDAFITVSPGAATGNDAAGKCE
jgi:hypothetical protein